MWLDASFAIPPYATCRLADDAITGGQKGHVAGGDPPPSFTRDRMSGDPVLVELDLDEVLVGSAVVDDDRETCGPGTRFLPPQSPPEGNGVVGVIPQVRRGLRPVRVDESEHSSSRRAQEASLSRAFFGYGFRVLHGMGGMLDPCSVRS